MEKIDRKMAAKMLKVSIRTVDRYITSKKLSIERVDGRIWMGKKEVQALRRRQQVDKVNIAGNMEMSIDKDLSTDVDMAIDTVDILSTSQNPKRQVQSPNSASKIYKNLYEELREEYRKQQERLEGANYRVGQLEAKVFDSVPLLDHQRLLSEEKAMRFEMEEKVETIRERLEKNIERLRDEITAKRLFAGALFIILLLQPAWFFFIVK